VFEHTPFSPEEEEFLFSSLPLKDECMAYGHIGHVRAELHWHSFYKMWCEDADHLRTPKFWTELNGLLKQLRTTTLQHEPALSDFGRKTQGVESTGQDISFKMQSAGYSYYIRCRPMTRGHDITIRAYDNAYLLPALEGKPRMPCQYEPPRKNGREAR